ncbi:hypothetical protein [Rhizobium leguminosarum]|uniref:hypothetical protein n=1 Tax=Rhizobium leguminosarum TaxID=384 RepID=UPI00103961E8|nr:hypothetical protein [Rhizobium leguminosarum]TBY41596.1 hypothetical protein E0H54_30875 [Rhizobium leguminosarum bv. viciae]
MRKRMLVNTAFACVFALWPTTGFPQSGATLKVMVATYGAAGQAMDATISLQQQCASAKGDCKIHCNNEFMHGDPAGGIQKECKIAWRCGSSKIVFDTVPEGSGEQTISCD